MKSPARPFLIGIVVASFLLAILLGALALRWMGAQMRADELSRLAAESQPIVPSDFAESKDPQPEPTPWFVELASSSARFELADLANPTTFESWRKRAESGDLGAEVRDAFARLETCAGSGAAAAVQRVIDVVAARDGIVEIPECGREAAALLALGVAPRVDVARRAKLYGPVSPRVVNEILDRTGAVFPNLPVPQAVELGQALAIEVVRASWNDHPELVPDLLRAQRDIARIFESVPLLVASFATIKSDTRLLEMLEFALSRLPRDTDLGWLEAELESIRPRARLAAACVGERAFGNRAYETMRTGAKPSGLAKGGLPTALTLSFDQATFLRSWRERIARMGDAAHRRGPEPSFGAIEKKLAPIATTIVRFSEGMLLAADDLEARVLLARAALLAFRTDAKSLLEFLAKTSDPYDGRPIRVGFTESGITTLWSVGPDGSDDGGLDDTRDIVWRFRPR